MLEKPSMILGARLEKLQNSTFIVIGDTDVRIYLHMTTTTTNLD